MSDKMRNANTATGRMNVLISAYACEPGKGSEAGVGWNMAIHMSTLHNVWVLTRANNQPVIERALPPECRAQFIYYDLPYWVRWWKRGPRGAQLYYYLWQVAAGRLLRKRYVGMFDVGHHVTFVRYWVPSCLSGLGVPYVIGPIGGGEFAPKVFERRFPLAARGYEMLRRWSRALAHLDPLLKASVTKADRLLVTTQATENCVRRLGGRHIALYPESGVSMAEYQRLSGMPGQAAGKPFVFICMGRLLALKGFDLAIRAFAESELAEAELWILGDGVERRRLQALAKRLGLQEKIVFCGWQPREQALETLSRAHVLVHPSLHDSGGWVCPEAMALAKPVICLDIGGPGAQVNERVGIKVKPTDYGQTIRQLAQALRDLAGDPDRRREMGDAGREEVARRYTWENKCLHYASIYEEIIKEKQR